MAGRSEKVETVGFVPAVSFLGFPDGVTGKWYYAGKQESASKEYVDLLRAKGLVAEVSMTMPASRPSAVDDESEEK